jgi:hypothetical protein
LSANTESWPGVRAHVFWGAHGSIYETEVEFRLVGGSIVLKKSPRKLDLAKWKGRCAGSFAKLGYSSVDEFIEDICGRCEPRS